MSPGNALAPRCAAADVRPPAGNKVMVVMGANTPGQAQGHWMDGHYVGRHGFAINYGQFSTFGFVPFNITGSAKGEYLCYIFCDLLFSYSYLTH